MKAKTRTIKIIVATLLLVISLFIIMLFVPLQRGSVLTDSCMDSAKRFSILKGERDDFVTANSKAQNYQSPNGINQGAGRWCESDSSLYLW